MWSEFTVSLPSRSATVRAMRSICHTPSRTARAFRTLFRAGSCPRESGGRIFRLRCVHLCVARNAAALEALGLNGASRVDALSDIRGALLLRGAGQARELNGRHLDMNIQPVEQGTRKARKISLNRLLGAGASAGRMTVISAGARVHRADYHRRARVRQRRGDARNCYFESSIGWRKTSIAWRENSGSSSKTARRCAPMISRPGAE